jgi:hypothetical protein
MNARAESCLRIMRVALTQATEWEAQREVAHADTLGDVAQRALEAAIWIEECAI